MSIPSNHLVNVEIKLVDGLHNEDLYIEACLRYPGGQVYCIPRTIIIAQEGERMFLPVIYLSIGNLKLLHKQGSARANCCYPEEPANKCIMTVTGDEILDLPKK